MSDKTVISNLGPRRLGKYRINGVLGEGAMGIVYGGHDPDIDRPVAIKTIHKHLIAAAGGEDWLARFAREAKAAGRVLHPNLVTIFDYLELSGVPYLVMEQLHASTLEDRLAQPAALAMSEVSHILSQILDGLSCIHAAGIVHRDMKPANVMLTDDLSVKLTDFGIARMTAMDKTGAGMVGTPHYMAPEQFSGANIDARADIYATGVVLYEILTGQRPFEGGGLEAILQASKNTPPPAPSAIVPDLSPALDAVVRTAMSVSADDRFASADDMKAALISAFEGTQGVVPGGAKRSPTAATPTMLSRMSAATLTQVEQNLVTRIGPIGQVLARRAAASATNVEELVALVLDELRPGEERNAMDRALRGLLASGVGPANARIPQADLARLSQLLMPHLGPISNVLVSRAAQNADALAPLIQTLADSIPDTQARQAFVTAASSEQQKGTQNAGS